ncbi:MBL fold metallo-hydrolase [Burkholderia multivorans]|uniref:MBL fold metallo-hydrolase n=1 Tax=Burkholderia multivorans TaxID=87883 RepID=UPI0007582F04|nr:MBL fold metallo-hydrolase [Burkholderia multivorans]KVZ28871.1 MBL fold metallo-hydrolase [Burkholderia multivorans]
MVIHHLNCISTCPLCGRLMNGSRHGIFERGSLACHCVLIETRDSLVLVDTGFGLRDVADPRSRLSRFFLGLVSPAFREEMTAIRQIERLGYDPRDVRHIVLSHLDFDHAGGLDDFPEATVHLLKTERAYAAAQRTWMDRQRFRPQQWSTSGKWRTYPDGGETWQGFAGVKALAGLPPSILLVPLRGHTLGHAGIAIETAHGWLLNAADAYFDAREMNANPQCHVGLRMYQWMLEKDRRARLANQAALRALAQRRNGVLVFSSHDPSEFERLADRAADVPAGVPASRHDV